MTSYPEELRRLARLPRSEESLKRLQAEADRLRDAANADRALRDAVSEVRDAADDLAGTLDEAGEDNPLVPWTAATRAALRAALEEFRLYLPAPADDPGTDDLVSELEDACAACEEDPEHYDEEDREELWAGATGAAAAIADLIEAHGWAGELPLAQPGTGGTG